MKRFIFLSFAFMALGFYELSGGADFDPVAAREAAVLARATSPEPQTPGAAQRLAGRDAPETAQHENDITSPEVSRGALNLVTFERTASPTPRATSPSVVKAPTIPPTSQTAQPDVIAPEQAVLPSLAFAGSSTQASSEAVQLSRDIRSVAGVAVNMRAGPGTQHGVLTQLRQDTQVEIIQDTGTGWVQLRPLQGGPTGWVADFLLTQS